MFIAIWEFRVRPGGGTRFEQLYGPAGDWVRLFRGDPDFLRTELIHDVSDRQRYSTLDFWESQKAYDEFRARAAEEYRQIACAAKV
jgi:heme-degrading monooxygenase HmoA